VSGKAKGSGIERLHDTDGAKASIFIPLKIKMHKLLILAKIMIASILKLFVRIRNINGENKTDDANEIRFV
jgi:hypothetical protein